jgi:large subunit ribosomal protein L23
MSKKPVNKAEIVPEVYDIIQSPLVTEKSQAGSENSKVTFRVSPFSDKVKVKKAVELIFGVNVKKVNIIVVKGKVKLFRGRPGKRNDVKKAIVTLAKGQVIDVASAV